MLQYRLRVLHALPLRITCSVAQSDKMYQPAGHSCVARGNVRAQRMHADADDKCKGRVPARRDQECWRRSQVWFLVSPDVLCGRVFEVYADRMGVDLGSIQVPKFACGFNRPLSICT